jgi:hypothetical protein
LGHLGSKIPIQRFFAAGERRTVMLTMQRFEAKGAVTRYRTVCGVSGRRGGGPESALAD